MKLARVNRTPTGPGTRLAGLSGALVPPGTCAERNDDQRGSAASGNGTARMGSRRRNAAPAACTRLAIWGIRGARVTKRTKRARKATSAPTDIEPAITRAPPSQTMNTTPAESMAV